MENQAITFNSHQEETDIETQYLIGSNKTILLCLGAFSNLS